MGLEGDRLNLVENDGETTTREKKVTMHLAMEAHDFKGEKLRKKSRSCRAGWKECVGWEEDGTPNGREGVCL